MITFEIMLFETYSKPVHQVTFPVSNPLGFHRTLPPYPTSCKTQLLSFTFDLIGHYENYVSPFNPLAYGLIILFERFLNHMREENIETGSIIYERFNKGLRELVYKQHKDIQKTKFSNMD